jgi:hypothetical protein
MDEKMKEQKRNKYSILVKKKKRQKETDQWEDLDVDKRIVPGH